MSRLKQARKELLSTGISIFISFLMTLMIFNMLPYQFYADDSQYYDIAKSFLDNGFFHHHLGSNIRTYLYPYLLSFIFEGKISHFLTNLALLQWAIFVTSAWLFCRLVFEADKLKRYCFAILICNPLLLVYACHALTDLLYTSLILVSLGFLFKSVYIYQTLGNFILDGKAMRAHNIKLLLCCGLGALFTGLCIALRPAGIFMIPVILIVNVVLICGYYKKNRNIKMLIGLSLVCALCFMLPLIPQMMINHLLFNRLTFLPTVELGSQQLIWGLEMLKFGPILQSGLELEVARYYNPYFVLIDSDFSPIHWYLSHPFLSIKIFFMKFVGAFHYDFFFPYINRLDQFSHPVTSTISILILIFGVFGILTRSRRLEIKIIAWPFLLAWCAVTLPSAIEQRFSLPVLAFLSTFSVIAMAYYLELPKSSWRFKGITTVLVLLYFIFLSIGHFVFFQMGNFKINRPVVEPISITSEMQNLPDRSYQYDLDLCELDGLQENYLMRGWLVENDQIKNPELMPKITVIIKKNDQYFSIKTDRIYRPETTSYLNKLFKNDVNYDFSSFAAAFSKKIEVGHFEVYLLVKNVNNEAYLIATQCSF